MVILRHEITKSYTITALEAYNIWIPYVFSCISYLGKLDFSEFTIMMREKLQGEDMEEEIRQAFR